MSFAELEAGRPEVPDHLNGALLIERMRGRLEHLEAGDDQWVPFYNPRLDDYDLWAGIPRFVVEPSAAFLASHVDLIRELAELRNRTAGRLSICYDVSIPNPLDLELPGFRPWTNASKLLSLDTLGGLLSGEIERAAESIQLQLRVANSLANEPNLIVKLVQFRLLQRCIDTLELTLRAAQLPPDRAVTLQEDLRVACESVSLTNGFRAERVFLVRLCDALISGRVSIDEIGIEHESAASLREHEIRQQQEVLADYYTRLIAASGDTRSLLAEARRLDQRGLSMAASLPNRDNLLTRNLLGSLSKAVELQARALARINCARAGLAAERMLHDTGRFPESVAQLIPTYLSAAPSDPFDERPLRMAKIDSGIVIYSVGEDVTDNGGRIGRHGETNVSFDVGFRLLNPVSRGLVLIERPPPTP